MHQEIIQLNNNSTYSTYCGDQGAETQISLDPLGVNGFNTISSFPHVTSITLTVFRGQLMEVSECTHVHRLAVSQSNNAVGRYCVKSVFFKLLILYILPVCLFVCLLAGFNKLCRFSFNISEGAACLLPIGSLERVLPRINVTKQNDSNNILNKKYKILSTKPEREFLCFVPCRLICFFTASEVIQ